MHSVPIELKACSAELLRAVVILIRSTKFHWPHAQLYFIYIKKTAKSIFTTGYQSMDRFGTNALTRNGKSAYYPKVKLYCHKFSAQQAQIEQSNSL